MSSAAAWSCVLAHGSTLISVGLGFLVQTYTHVKKSQACMQTNEWEHKGTYENGRHGEDRGDAGRRNQPGEPRETKGVGWREGRSEERDGERGHKGGSLLFLQNATWRRSTLKIH